MDRSGQAIIRNKIGIELYARAFQDKRSMRYVINRLKRLYKNELLTGHYFLSIIFYE